MTPPKIAPNQTPPQILSCEKPPEPLDPALLPKVEDVPVFELAYSPIVGSPIKPHPVFANPFDPTRYGLPSDWEAKTVQLDLKQKEWIENDPESRMCRQRTSIIIDWHPGNESDLRTPASDLLAGIPNLFPAQAPWIQNLIHLLNQVKRADLDMYHISVNGGTNLRRFSEYAPKHKPLRAPNLDVQENTTAYVHGEIRPVEGHQPDSLITRWVIRYDKPLLHESGLKILGFSAADAPDIEYDKSFSDWQAVKDISGGDLEYENPQHTGSPLRTPWNSVAPPLPEGHRDWMIAFNPVADSIAASIKAAGGFGKLDLLDFWPFEGAIDGGRGKLYLWAFNPTVGITPHFNRLTCEENRRNKTPETKLPVHCKVRPNTMPRKPGDLLDFFSPLLDSYRGGLLKHAAPYYNPNSDYIAPFVEKGEKLLQWAKQNLGRDYSDTRQACEDLKGRWNQEQCLLPLPEFYGTVAQINEEREKECKELTKLGKEEQCERPIGRTPIPRREDQVDAINQQLALFGLPPIGRRRGSIIDWASLDLMHDIDRLRKMKDKPHVVAHLQLNPGTLPLSFGKLQVDGKTDLKVEYFVKPVEVPIPDRPGKTKWEAQAGLRVTLSPLKLHQTDLTLMGFRLEASGPTAEQRKTLKPEENFALKADQLQIEIPNILGMNETQPQTRPPVTAKIIGAEARGLHLTSLQGDVDIAMDHAVLEELSFHFDHPPLLFGKDEDKQAERAERLLKSQGLDCGGKTNPCLEPEWQASFKGLRGKGLTVGLPQIQGFTVEQFSVPTIEVSQRFKTGEKETVGDFLKVSIPNLESKGFVDLDFKGKEDETSKETSVHLEGASVLKNVELTVQFKGDHSLWLGGFDLSGIIDRATLSKKDLGEISFTTKTNGHPVQPLSGHVGFELNNPTKLPFQKVGPKAPPPKYDVDLDLPYVGFEAKGDFTIPPGSATLRHGKVDIHGESKVTGFLEGQLNLGDASFERQHKGPLELGRMDMLPALNSAHAKGNFKFEIFEDGFRFFNPLYNAEDPEHTKLSLGFSVGGTRLHHCPNFPKGPMEHITKGEAFETNFILNKAQVEVLDLAEIEMRSSLVEGEIKTRLTRLKSGPLFVRQIEGGGSIWVNSLLFGMVKVSFPMLGGTLTEQDAKLPDSRALTSHLPEEYKKKLREDLAEGDYLYTAGIDFNRTDKGWNVDARDVIFNLHEKGGLHQYAMLQIPQISFGMLGEKLILPPLVNHLANVFVDVPTRGGLTHIGTPDRWRRALKGEKK